MNALALMVPRQQSRASDSERSEEEEFHALVESIETLLFTSADHPETLDLAVLTESLAELEARWPEAAAELRPRVEARGRHRA
ncbi:hypothetical protein SAMN04487968_102275 [Nocardioides terrae]|uniref:Uncharacterized protein n=1 Tax=Nocardioides terrae TaxID=574651 RepID=A0A1I1EWT4_9ACTN|nr:hypothetical protein [Nocardioides terrae]SFB91491.1 hypothetical protein SAMN04487968_102275 [Nocardioides terrae]